MRNRLIFKRKSPLTIHKFMIPSEIDISSAHVTSVGSLRLICRCPSIVRRAQVLSPRGGQLPQVRTSRGNSGRAKAPLLSTGGSGIDQTRRSTLRQEPRSASKLDQVLRAWRRAELWGRPERGRDPSAARPAGGRQAVPSATTRCVPSPEEHWRHEDVIFRPWTGRASSCW